VTGRIAARLAELGLELPAPMAPVATYVPFTRSGPLLHVSGQGPVRDGTFLHNGKLGAGVTVEQGIEAARLTALNLLAQAGAALVPAFGDDGLDHITRVVRLFGLVACTPDFIEHPRVIDGASEVMAAVFAERGRHARAAGGAPCLPFDTCVEIDAIFEVG
jgi:enamine deaminase RidA (YjgF/YER057c/UK114 family)